MSDRSPVTPRRRGSRSRAMTVAVVLGALVAQVLAVPAQAGIASVRRAGPDATPDARESARNVTQALGRLPMSFEANVGQTDRDVRYLARGRGYALFLTDDEAVLALRPSGAGRKAAAVRMSAVGGRRVAPTGVDRLPSRTNYLIGADPSAWRTDVASYGKVRYAAVYPGIDLDYYGTERELEYDFIVAPGADPARIALALKGTQRLEVASDGALLLHTAAGTIRQERPFAYQDIDGQRREVASAYVLDRGNVRFRLGAYDPRVTLVIDPSVSYSTFLGGSDGEAVNGVAVDAAGNAYLTGFTGSADFPKLSAYDATHTTTGGYDVFVTKLNAAGSAVLYSTYIGGTGVDKGHAIAVDSAGRAYVTGETSYEGGAPVFPHTAGALVAPQDFQRGFATVLNATGNALVYSGTFDATAGYGITVYRETATAKDFAYLVGETASPDFPLTANAYDRCLGTPDDSFAGCSGGTDGFFMKLNPHDAANDLVYATYLGGGSTATDYQDADAARAVVADVSGKAYITGETVATNFPVKSAPAGGTAIHPSGVPDEWNPSDAFVAKIDPVQTGAASLVYSSYLGGNGDDVGTGIDVDSSGNAYVTGTTASTTFPRTVGAFDTTCGTDNACNPVDGYRTTDAFVTKIAAAGNSYAYSTYLGGSKDDDARGIGLDSLNNAYITGVTDSTNFPLKDAVVRVHIYLGDAFVAKLAPAGNALAFSSFFGSIGDDESNAIAVAPGGTATIGGVASYYDFPYSNGAYDTACGTEPLTETGCGTGPDAFAMRIAPVAMSDMCPVATSLAGAESADDENVIVKFRPAVTQRRQADALQAAGVERVRHLGLIGAHVVRSAGRRAVDVARDLAARSDVEYVTLDHRVQPMGYPDEPKFGQLWGLHNTGQAIESFDDFGTPDIDIDGLEASRITLGDPNLVVAVIDDGVDFSHPDLAGRQWRNPGESGSGKETNGRDDDANGYIDDVVGWDFRNNDKTVFDAAAPGTHGTHVAGTIAGNINNAGIVGVAPNVKIMALKFLQGTAGGTASHAIAAIQYAAKKGVTIANNSWGGAGCNPALKDAIQKAPSMLFVAAAGNGGPNGAGDNNDIAPFYPASYDVPTVVSVAAVDKDGYLADFSNWGYRNVDLAGPGVQVYSSVPGGGYAYYPGTSMASPHVAGVAALARSVNRSLTIAQMRDVLLNTGMPLPSLKDRTATGRLLNAKAAVDRAIALDTTPPSVVTPTHAFLAGSTLGTSTVPVNVTWPASTDAGSGVVRYELSQSANGGSTYTVVATVAATTRSVLRQLTPSTSTQYRFRVRTQDRKGNWSAYGTGPAFTVVAYPETARTTAPTLAYAGTWTTVARTGAHGGYVRSAKTAGATATFTFTGRGVAAVMPFRSDLGSAKACLYQGATLVVCSTIDLSPSTTSVPRRIVFARGALPTTTSHRLVISWVSGVIDLDAFTVLP